MAEARKLPSAHTAYAKTSASAPMAGRQKVSIHRTSARTRRLHPSFPSSCLGTPGSRSSRFAFAGPARDPKRELRNEPKNGPQKALAILWQNSLKLLLCNYLRHENRRFKFGDFVPFWYAAVVR